MIRHLFVCIFFNPFVSYCQEDDTKFNDILFHYGVVDYGAEYYQVDEKISFLEHHFLFQPMVTDVNVLNVEFGFSQSFLENGDFFTPADLSFTYQHNFKFQKYGENGFQGIGVSGKFIVPTGRDEYYSGFDSWSFEPLIGVQWLFNNTDWFTSIQVRYNYSFAALPGKKTRYSFFRLEYFIGIENEKMWLFIGPDYRYIVSDLSHNFFFIINGAYKINNSLGIWSKMSPRLAGVEFFKSLLVVGCYVYL